MAPWKRRYSPERNMKNNTSVATSDHGIELPVTGRTFPGVPFDDPELELPLDP